MTALDLPKAYDFKSTEGRIYQWWEQQGYFQPVNDPKNLGLTQAENLMSSRSHPLILRVSCTWGRPCLSPWKI